MSVRNFKAWAVGTGPTHEVAVSSGGGGSASPKAVRQSTILAEAEELLRQNRKWSELSEMPINFPPTYKYVPETQMVLDTSKKRRVPSWTDRILFKPSFMLTPLAYDAIFHDEALFISDHKPVFAQFEVDWNFRRSDAAPFQNLVPVTHGRGGCSSAICSVM